MDRLVRVPAALLVIRAIIAHTLLVARTRRSDRFHLQALQRRAIAVQPVGAIVPRNDMRVLDALVRVARVACVVVDASLAEGDVGVFARKVEADGAVGVEPTGEVSPIGRMGAFVCWSVLVDCDLHISMQGRLLGSVVLGEESSIDSTHRPGPFGSLHLERLQAYNDPPRLGSYHISCDPTRHPLSLAPIAQSRSLVWATTTQDTYNCPSGHIGGSWSKGT
jgi:hypothetical protein